MLIMSVLLAAVIIWQWDMFTDFFALTGLSLKGTLSKFTATGI